MRTKYKWSVLKVDQQKNDFGKCTNKDGSVWKRNTQKSFREEIGRLLYVHKLAGEIYGMKKPFGRQLVRG